MKKFLAPSIILFLFITAAFTPRTFTVESVRNEIIEFQLGMPTRWTSPDVFPDTTLSTTYTQNGTDYKVYPMKMCATTPSYMYYNMYIAMDSNAYWNYTSFTYDKNFRDRFKDLFGEDIIASSFKTASLDAQDNVPSEFRFYNPKALEAAFKKLYLPPTADYKGIPMKKLYDISLRDYMRDVGKTLSTLFQNKAAFEKVAAEYLAKAKTDPGFDGQTFSYRVARSLIGTDEILTNLCYDERGPVRIVSIALRRQCDGSLPTLSKIYKKIVQDYDPEYYEQIKSKLW